MAFARLQPLLCTEALFTADSWLTLYSPGCGLAEPNLFAAFFFLSLSLEWGKRAVRISSGVCDW